LGIGKVDGEGVPTKMKRRSKRDAKENHYATEHPKKASFFKQ